MKVRIHARLLTEINVCFDPDGYFGLSWSCSGVEVFFLFFVWEMDSPCELCSGLSTPDSLAKCLALTSVLFFAKVLY